MLDARALSFTLLLFTAGACGGSKSATGAGGSGGGGVAGGSGAGGTAGSAGTAGRDAAVTDGAAPDGPGTDGAACATPCGVGMTCVMGTCAPAPVELTRIATGCSAMSLAINGGTIYFSDQDHGTIGSISTVGGAAAQMIASGQAMPTVIVADDHGVYWANQGDNKLMKAPLPTGAAAPLLPAFADAPVSGLALHAGTLFFSNAKSVQKIDTTMAAATPVPVGMSDGKPRALALSDVAVFWPADLSASVQRHAQDGSGTTDNMAESQGSLLLDAIAVAGGQVLWGSSLNVLSKPVTADRGTAPGSIDTANSDVVTGLAAADTTVFLGEDGTIEKARIGAVSATVIADGQPQPGSLLLDATSVYWRTLDKGACAVMKLAR